MDAATWAKRREEVWQTYNKMLLLWTESLVNSCCASARVMYAVMDGLVQLAMSARIFQLWDVVNWTSYWLEKLNPIREKLLSAETKPADYTLTDEEVLAFADHVGHLDERATLLRFDEYNKTYPLPQTVGSNTFWKN